jgi:hypothetical protein
MLALVPEPGETGCRRAEREFAKGRAEVPILDWSAGIGRLGIHTNFLNLVP